MSQGKSSGESDLQTVEELSEQRWNAEKVENVVNLMDTSFDMALYADGAVGFIYALANVSVFPTDDGLVLVDTSSMAYAPKVIEELKKHLNFPERRIHTVIYTHGHIDHTQGALLLEKKQIEAGKGSFSVVSHAHVARRFDRYKRSLGYNSIINRRQFQIDWLQWPSDYRYPDVIHYDGMTLKVGELTLELHHDRGETDDASWVYVPKYKTLCTGDFFIWATPNCGNPQKAERYPLEWAAALRRMDLCGAELLLPGHGPPIQGAARVRQALRETAEFLEQLCEQTLNLINNGARLEEVLRTVRPSATLLRRPYLQPVYDDPQFIVRTVWRRFAGWWDQDPSTLRPPTDSAHGRELLLLSGGSAGLARRARELLAAGPEQARVAASMLERACAALPRDQELQLARAEVYALLEQHETCLMSRSIYRDASQRAAEEADQTKAKL